MSEESKEQSEPRDKNEREERIEDENSGDEGFYNRGGDQEQESNENLEAPGRKARKAKHIKKRKKKGESTKKQNQERKRKENLIAANDTAKQIIKEMRACEEKDEKLLQQKKKANHKLRYAIKLEKDLRNVYVCEQFLENGGLECFFQWVRRMDDGTESPLTLRKKVLNIILALNVNDEHIDRASELKKFIQKGKRNVHTKDLCEAIISKWGDGI